MDETTNITLTVVSAIVGSMIGLGFEGLFGAVMGFILVIVMIWIFRVFRNYMV